MLGIFMVALGAVMFVVGAHTKVRFSIARACQCTTSGCAVETKENNPGRRAGARVGGPVPG